MSETNTEASREAVEKAVAVRWPGVVNVKVYFAEPRWRVDVGHPPIDEWVGYEVHDDEATGDLVFVEE